MKIETFPDGSTIETNEATGDRTVCGKLAHDEYMRRLRDETGAAPPATFGVTPNVSKSKTNMTREKALPYVSFVVDSALCGRELGADIYAIVRQDGFSYPSRLVGWQCGYEPLFVAVHSYCDTPVTDEEAEELATDFLAERNWFNGDTRPADFIL